jgi:hypothetical protein
MSKIGSNDPFGRLKHKLWIEERPIKVKNRPDFLACRGPATYHWKVLNEGYNFAFNLTSIGGLYTKLWASKVMGVLILGISRVLRQNDIWMLVPSTGTKYTIWGRWWFPPSPGRAKSSESMFAYGSSVHQRCFSCTLTNSLFGLCRSVWIIDLLVNLPSPHPKASTCPSTPKCYELGSAPQLLFFMISTSLDS